MPKDIERTVGQWFALREDLTEALKDAGEILGGEYELYDLAEVLLLRGWVTGWPNEGEDSE